MQGDAQAIAGVPAKRGVGVGCAPSVASRGLQTLLHRGQFGALQAQAL